MDRKSSASIKQETRFTLPQCKKEGQKLLINVFSFEIPTKKIVMYEERICLRVDTYKVQGNICLTQLNVYNL